MVCHHDSRDSVSNVQVRSLLGDTARDLGPAGRDPSFGYGLVDAAAAVAAAADALP